MEFRTIVKPLDRQGLIDHTRRVLLIGSCFTDNIGQCLVRRLFNVSVNPSGPLYNPMSIAHTLGRLASGRLYTPADTFLADGLWRSYDFHSRYASVDQAKALRMMNDSVTAFAIPDVLIITLGSDATFVRKDTGEVVANCHKQPQLLFDLVHQPIEAMRQTLTDILRQLREMNPRLQVILTVSPVRHWSYGPATNSRSKGRLVETAMSIADTADYVTYFPAYEIMVDDLRDYRFYASDMLHPSEVAIDYIYQIFSDSFFTEQTAKLAGECAALTRRVLHRPLTDDHQAYRRFMEDTLCKARSMMAQHPQLTHVIQALIHNHDL